MIFVNSLEKVWVWLWDREGMVEDGFGMVGGNGWGDGCGMVRG